MRTLCLHVAKSGC